MSYWDSSALAKLNLSEPDWADFQSLAERSAPLRTSPLGQFETILTIRRQESDGRLDAQTADFLADELLIDLTIGVIEVVVRNFDLHAEFQHVVQTCLRCSPPILLRKLDAVHLAAVLHIGETELVSNDVRQWAAAVALGMAVLP